MSEPKLFYGHPLEFDAEAHAYTWAGQFVPGVTFILKCLDKPALMPWAAKMTSEHWLKEIKAGRTDYEALFEEAKKAHRNFSSDAAEIGKNVHSYAEAILKGLPPPPLTTDQAKKGAEAFHNWLNAHKVKLISSERLVFSKQYYFAGTCDLEAEIDGELVVGDFKTSSGIYNEARFQTAAYQHAIQEETGKKFQGRIVIRFDKKTGKFETKTFRNFEVDFEGFAAARIITKTLKAIKDEPKEGKRKYAV